jgi:hypothetical protein
VIARMLVERLKGLKGLKRLKGFEKAKLLGNGF